MSLDSSLNEPPLQSVRVIELGTYMSAPVAGMILADLGAEVVKVEPPTGDPFRRFGRPTTPDSAEFINSNRGKRSVVLDLKLEEHRLRFMELVKSADLLLCNWRPGVAERLGIGDDALAATNPLLIRLWVDGFGSDGPSSEEPVYDTVIQARSGYAVVGTPGTEAALAGGYPMDKTSAHFAALVSLAALYERDRRKQGTCIRLAMIDVAAYVNFPDLFASHTLVDAPRDVRTPVRTLPATDGWFVLAPVTARDLRAAFEAVGAPDLASEVLGIRDPNELMSALTDRLSPLTRSESIDFWVKRFRNYEVPVAPCLGLDDHLADPQVVHNQIYSSRLVPDFGYVRSVRFPAVAKTWGTLSGQGPAPRLGQDSRAFESCDGWNS
jgi:crotonobetainyl-CoA:carnitine CoA-transferase CaiB-like acyl-CoA transferase